MTLANQAKLVEQRGRKMWHGKQTKMLLDESVPIQNAIQLRMAKRKAYGDYNENFECSCGLILTKSWSRIFMYCPFCGNKYDFHKF